MSKTLSRVGLVAALLVGPQQVCCARWTATSASGNGQAATSFVSVSTSTPFLPRLFQRARAMAQSNNVGTIPRVPKMKAAGGSVNGEHPPPQQRRYRVWPRRPLCMQAAPVQPTRAQCCAGCVWQAFLSLLSTLENVFDSRFSHLRV